MESVSPLPPPVLPPSRGAIPPHTHLYFSLVCEGRSLLEYCLDSADKSPSPLALPPRAGSKVGLAAVVMPLTTGHKDTTVMPSPFQPSLASSALYFNYFFCGCFQFCDVSDCEGRSIEFFSLAKTINIRSIDIDPSCTTDRTRKKRNCSLHLTEQQLGSF